jgi:hypothetical protein
MAELCMLHGVGLRIWSAWQAARPVLIRRSGRAGSRGGPPCDVMVDTGMTGSARTEDQTVRRLEITPCTAIACADEDSAMNAVQQRPLRRSRRR